MHFAFLNSFPEQFNKRYQLLGKRFSQYERLLLVWLKGDIYQHRNCAKLTNSHLDLYRQNKIILSFYFQIFYCAYRSNFNSSFIFYYIKIIETICF